MKASHFTLTTTIVSTKSSYMPLNKRILMFSRFSSLMNVDLAFVCMREKMQVHINFFFPINNSFICKCSLPLNCNSIMGYDFQQVQVFPYMWDLVVDLYNTRNQFSCKRCLIHQVISKIVIVFEKKSVGL